MDTDLNPLLAALAVFVVIPTLLWVEAVLGAPRWFKILTSVLIVLWFIPLLSITIGESLCEGSALKGLVNCLGPLEPTFYNRLVHLFPLMPIAFAIYVGAVVARAIEAATKAWRSRMGPNA